jgi:hypothetical protein
MDELDALLVRVRAGEFATNGHRDHDHAFGRADARHGIGVLPSEFWDARPRLAHVRDAAWSRQRAPAAVLHAVLARIAAVVPHTVDLPALVGAPANLSYLAAVVGPSGVGKSTAVAIARELVPRDLFPPVALGEDRNVADCLPLGSGEGLVESLFGTVVEASEKGTSKTRAQVRFNAFFYADEGEALTALAGRAGAILRPVLRSIFSRQPVGQTNASAERRRMVDAGWYAFGFVAAFQPTVVAGLLDDAEAGTPQRFAFCSAIDPTLPETPPTWPGPLGWRPPERGHLATIEQITGSVRHVLAVAAPVAAEVRARDACRQRGTEHVAPLDAHRDLLRLKTAGLLAIFDDRLDISSDDWSLAAMVMEANDQIRDAVIAVIAEDEERREAATSHRLARRAAESDAAVRQRRTVECATKLADKVRAEPDRWTRIDLYRAMRHHRDVFEDALDHAIAAQWIIEEHEPSHTGDTKRVLLPGPQRPSR